MLIFDKIKYVFLIFFSIFLVQANAEESQISIIVLAGKGDSESQFKLGVMYYEADGVPQDYASAKYWFEESAKKNHAGSQNALGGLYAHGMGVRQSYLRAYHWIKKSAEQNHPIGLYNLAVALKNGLGVDKDLEKSVYYYHKAATYGYSKAVPALCYHYYEIENYREAERWCLTAAYYNFDQSQYILGYMYEHGIGVKKNRESAIFWFEKSVLHNNDRAQNDLGVIYYSATDDPISKLKGIELFRDSAKQGNILAQLNLANHYFSIQSVKMASFWMQKSAEAGYIDAQIRLGKLYLEGDALEKNYQKGIYWIQKAADQGHTESQYNLGHIFRENKYIKKDDFISAMWFEKAAKQGHLDAQFNIGVIYHRGRGVKQNIDTAIYWYEKAANRGDDDAIYNLNLLRNAKKRENKFTVEDARVAIIVAHELSQLFKGNQSDTSENTDNNNRKLVCYEQSKKEITECSVNLGECNTIGCSTKVTCYGGGFFGSSCESVLERVDSYGVYFCEEENPRNYSKNIEDVLNEMCD